MTKKINRLKTNGRSKKGGRSTLRTNSKLNLSKHNNKNNKSKGGSKPYVPPSLPPRKTAVPQTPKLQRHTE